MVIAEIGFALAIYRFVISGIEDYRKAGRILKRYKAFDDGTKEVFVILTAECNIFMNTFRLLLGQLPNTDDEWESPEIRRTLQMKLTTSYTSFVGTGVLLNQSLKNLANLLEIHMGEEVSNE